MAHPRQTVQTPRRGTPVPGPQGLNCGRWQFGCLACEGSGDGASLEIAAAATAAACFDVKDRTIEKVIDEMCGSCTRNTR